jgi:hypothetical protein
MYAGLKPWGIEVASTKTDLVRVAIEAQPGNKNFFSTVKTQTTA